MGFKTFFFEKNKYCFITFVTLLKRLLGKVSSFSKSFIFIVGSSDL